MGKHAQTEIFEQLSAFTGKWPVESGYEIAHVKKHEKSIEVIRPCFTVKSEIPFRLIDPGVFPKIAWEFSKVRNAKELLAFNRKFGLLGFDRLAPPKAKVGGDPVKWALRHAAAVAAAFEIISHIKRGPSQVRAELPGLLRSIGLELMGMLPNGELEISFTQTGAIWEGGKEKKIGFLTPGSMSFRDWPSDPLRVAWQVLSDLINDNIRNLRVKVSEEQLRPRFAFDALLQTIYWSLANELGDIGVRRCCICNKFFRAKRFDAEHCSDACRMKASRDRKKKKERRRKHHGLLQKKRQ